MWMAVRCVGFSAHWKGDDFACIGFAGLPGLWRNRYEKGNDGLVDARAAELAEDPFDGAVYAFRGRRAALIKLIWHDGESGSAC